MLRTYSDIADAVISRGYSIIDSYFTVAQIDNIKSMVTSLSIDHQQIDPLTRKSNSTPIHFNLHTRHSDFSAFLLEPIFQEVSGLLLNDKYYNMPQNLTHNFVLAQYTARSSGSVELPVHRDDRNPLNNSKYPCVVQWLIPLEATTLDNGCTFVVEDSHHDISERDPSLVCKKPIPLEPGQILVWDGRLLHGAFANRTLLSRWAIIITFTRWHFRQQFNMIATMDKQQALSLSDQEKFLYGANVIERFSPEEALSMKGNIAYADLKISQIHG